MTAKTETDKERRKRERDDLLALLLAFLLLQRQKLGAIAMSIALDGAPAASALAIAYAVLLRTHAQSIAYGRTLAVQAAPASAEPVEPAEEPADEEPVRDTVREPLITDDDTAAAVAVMAEQAEYLREFFRAIEEGRYTEPATDDNPAGVDIEGMMRRMGLYVRRAIGSANKAWVDALPRDAEIYWKMSESEHCANCPDLEANSPYTKATLPTVPGACQTECQLNCMCFLETADGDEGIPVRMEGL